jgi:hypothetical protein
MTQTVIKSLVFRIESPSLYVYNHPEGEIRIEFLGRYIVGGKNRPRWLLTAGKQKMLGFSKEQCAEMLAVAIHNATIDQRQK